MWFYALAGALVGFTFELAICVPLDTLTTYLFECFYSGQTCKVENILAILENRKWFPGDLIVGIIYGIPLGLLYWRIRVHRLNLEALTQELQKQNRYLIKVSRTMIYYSAGFANGAVGPDIYAR